MNESRLKRIEKQLGEAEAANKVMKYPPFKIREQICVLKPDSDNVNTEYYREPLPPVTLDYPGQITLTIKNYVPYEEYVKTKGELFHV